MIDFEKKETGAPASRQGDVSDVRVVSDARPANNGASPDFDNRKIEKSKNRKMSRQVNPVYFKSALIALVAVAVIVAAIAAMVVSSKRAAEANAVAERAAAAAEKVQAELKTAEKAAAGEEAKARAKEADAKAAADNLKAKEAEAKKSALEKETAALEREKAAELRKARDAEADAAKENRLAEKAKAEAALAEKQKADALAKAERAKADKAAEETAYEKLRSEKTIAEAKLLELRKTDFETLARDLREWQQDLEERERAITPEKTITDLNWAGGAEDSVIDADGTVRKKAKVPYLAENDRTLPCETRALAKAERLLQEAHDDGVTVVRSHLTASIERLYAQALKEDRVVDANYYRDVLKSLDPDWTFSGAK